MDILLDTHALLWALMDPEKLSDSSAKILLKEDNNILISQISIYEIAIKQKVGKIKEFNITISGLIDYINLMDYRILPVKNEHLKAYSNFVFNDNHKDPFDRLLIATSFSEKIPVISKDEKFSLYKNTIEVIW